MPLPLPISPCRPRARDYRLQPRGDPRRPRRLDARSRPAFVRANRARLEGHPDGELARDEILDNITLYWVTNTGASAARLYWENARIAYKGDVSVPTAFTVFAGEIWRAPRSWVERTYRNLIYFHEVDKGGHFAAWEQPQTRDSEMALARLLGDLADR